MTPETLRRTMRTLGHDPGKKSDVDAFGASLGVSWRTVYNWLSGKTMCRMAVTSIERLLERKRAGK